MTFSGWNSRSEDPHHSENRKAVVGEHVSGSSFVWESKEDLPSHMKLILLVEEPFDSGPTRAKHTIKMVSAL